MRTYKSNLSSILALAALVLASLACALTNSASPTPDLVSTLVASDLQGSETPAATATVVIASPTASVPSATPFPTSTSAPPAPAPTAAFVIPGALRVSFPTGATATNLEGDLSAGSTRSYVVRAGQGQPLLATVSSLNQDVILSIRGQNGATLLPESQSRSGWQGLLPATQDYYLTVKAGGANTHYALSITIASRIQFASGAVSASVNGTTTNGSNVSYVLRASGGQHMYVTLNAPAGDAALTIWGFSDGQPYVRSVTEQTSFDMVLPSTQDYIIDVVPRAGLTINYTLTVTVQ